MENKKIRASRKPWKEKPKKNKKMKLWLKLLICAVAVILVGALVFVGCSLSKDPASTSHKNEETVILEEFTQLGEEALSPESISEKALKFVALHVGKDISDVTTDDILAVFNMLKTGSLIFDVPQGDEKNTDTVTQKDKFYNILVVGRDKVALNTDVLICASFDVANNKAATVQIPRDSYVEDEKGVKSKINAVFSRGYLEAKSELQKLKKSANGKTDAEIAELCKNSTIEITPETLKAYISGKKKLETICTDVGIKGLQDVITRTFGIYFDYYAVVSTDAFVQIVDAVGGVDVYVQQPMHYEDPLQNLYIHIDAGQQHLDGKKAEGFVRFRSGYVQADIGRMDAQKIFLTAFFKKLLSFSSLTRIDDIVNAVYKNLTTDMTIENILAFVRPAMNINMAEITMLNMQGVPYNNGMYYSLNKAENLKIVNEHFNVFSHDLKDSAVHVVELVEQSSDGEYEGMTMEEIKDKQPHINFIRPTQTTKAPETEEQPTQPSEEKEKTDSDKVTEETEKTEKTEETEKAEGKEEKEASESSDETKKEDEPEKKDEEIEDSPEEDEEIKEENIEGAKEEKEEPEESPEENPEELPAEGNIPTLPDESEKTSSEPSADEASETENI